MKSILTASLAILSLSACGIVGPIQTSFPEPPPHLMKAPGEMKTLATPEELKAIKITDETPSKISPVVVIKTITDNYKTCNLYEAQLFGLQEWIREQKKLSP